MAKRPRVKPTRVAPPFLYAVVYCDSGIVLSKEPVKWKQQESPRATRPESEEVQIPASIMSLQTLRHGETPTRKTDAWGTPVSVRRGVLRQWYPLIEGARQVETTGKRPGHPSNCHSQDRKIND